MVNLFVLNLSFKDKRYFCQGRLQVASQKFDRIFNSLLVMSILHAIKVFVSSMA